MERTVVNEAEDCCPQPKLVAGIFHSEDLLYESLGRSAHDVATILDLYHHPWVTRHAIEFAMECQPGSQKGDAYLGISLLLEHGYISSTSIYAVNERIVEQYKRDHHLQDGDASRVCLNTLEEEIGYERYVTAQSWLRYNRYRQFFPLPEDITYRPTEKLERLLAKA